MSDDRLEVVRARIDGNNAGASANRRARVERSRKRAAAAKAGVDAVEADEAIEDAADVEAETTDDLVDTDGTVETEDASDDADASDEGSAADESDEAGGHSEAEAGGEHQDGEYAAGEYPGSVLPDADGNGPDTHPIKGNAESMLYHTPDSRYYKVTKAEVWFDTEENAEAAGFAKPGTAARTTRTRTDSWVRRSTRTASASA